MIFWACRLMRANRSFHFEAGIYPPLTRIFAPGERAQLTETNVNLYCGVVMLAFGGFMLALAWRGKKHGS